jgi:DNA ligase-1
LRAKIESCLFMKTRRLLRDYSHPFFQTMSSFPTLYGEASTGKAKQWSVKVEARDSTGVIIVTHGYVDGKQQVNERVVSTGKNIGKKNETTPLQQAISEAQALWNKKRDAGYSAAVGGAGASSSTAAAGAEASSDEESPTAATAAGDVPLPMLAQDYNKRGKNIVFPCYAQRKLDGVRCVAIQGKGLYSRNGKAFSAHLSALRAEIDSLPAGTILDGELYADKEHLSFQEIVGLTKKATLKAGDAEKLAHMYLCVYDTIRPGTNKERKTELEELFASRKFKHIKLLPTAVCNSDADAKFLHSQFVEEGYEGLILRNTGGLYKVGHRSADLQKYKEFLDEEFTIVGFKEGDGIEKGCVLWRCVTKTGVEFDCRPRGTREDRAALYLAGAAHVGKKLTVRFQEWTDDHVPRFPVGIAIRDYE